MINPAPFHWSFPGYLIVFFSSAVNFLIRTITGFLQRFRINRIYSLNNLIFPYSHSVNETFCYAAGCEEDWKLLRQLRFLLKERFYVVSDEMRETKRFNVIPFDKIPEKKFTTVVIPSKMAEENIERKCLEVYKKYKHEFSLWDPHNYFLTAEIYKGGRKAAVNKNGFATQRYRRVDLSVSPGNIILPSYYANWGYVNYLLAEVVKDGMNIMDMWAGSGSIGFSVKKEAKNISISFADINYFSVLSMKTTMMNDKALEGKVWLSDVFDAIPETERYDLIVGNPPCGRDIFTDFINIGGADQEWKSHLAFFLKADKYLNKRGKICIVEQICKIEKHTNKFVENFYKGFEKQFPAYRIIEMRPLAGTFLSTILMEKY